jgi:exodeoxyribonuclease VII small subunit
MEKLSFEEANLKLETLVAELEEGKLNLEDSMKRYAEAFELLDYCYKQLNECKGQIMDINARLEAMNNGGAV